jgi:hypothetical protein
LEENTWIPIYMPLIKKLDTEYKGVNFYQDLKWYIQPRYENVLLVCDGLDEYSSNPEDIKLLRDKLSDIRDKLFNSTNLSISDLKIIFTSRLEAGVPSGLGIKRFVRLLPFTPQQVTAFFKKYELQDLTFKDIEKYGLQEEKSFSYKWDLLKPLFCWMFAISYNDLEITENMDVGIARLILYSTFIHSILKGKYDKSSGEIANEKWIMRKIAALKNISEDVYEEDLPCKLGPLIEDEQKEYIEPFIEGKQKKSSSSEKSMLSTILTSYFKLDEKSNGKHSVDFLHKSFQEYLLAEYYIESILHNKGYRLNVGQPSDVTIDFLSSLLSMIKDSHKKEYEKCFVA